MFSKDLITIFRATMFVLYYYFPYKSIKIVRFLEILHIAQKQVVKFVDNMYIRIENLCKKSGITISEMCSKLGVSRGTITDYKMGRTKSLSQKTTLKIADYFGVTTDYLLTGEQKETSKDISSATKFSKHEIQLIKQYRAKPEMQNAVDKLLGI